MSKEGKKIKKTLIKYIKSLSDEDLLETADYIEIKSGDDVIASANITDGPGCDPIVGC